jgi:hypothetical protein
VRIFQRIHKLNVITAGNSTLIFNEYRLLTKLRDSLPVISVNIPVKRIWEILAGGIPTNSFIPSVQSFLEVAIPAK